MEREGSIVDWMASSAISAYDYQSALKTGTQSAAVLQALAQVYTSQNMALPGGTSAPDVLTELAGSSALGALVSGIYSVSVANGGDFNPAQGMTALGGLDASSVPALLGGGPSGASSMNLSVSEALAAYQYQQTVIESADDSSSAATTYAQRLALTAQIAGMTAPLNLLG